MNPSVSRESSAERPQECAAQNNFGSEPPFKVFKLVVESVDNIGPKIELNPHRTNLEKATHVYVTSSRYRRRKQHPTKNFKLAFAPLPIKAACVLRNVPEVIKQNESTSVVRNELAMVKSIQPATVKPGEPRTVETNEPIVVESIQPATVVTTEPATVEPNEPAVVEPNEQATGVPNQPEVAEPIEPAAVQPIPGIVNPNIFGLMPLCENMMALNSEVSISGASNGIPDLTNDIEEESELNSDLELEIEMTEIGSPTPPGRSTSKLNRWEKLSARICRAEYLDLTINERYKLIRLRQLLEKRESLEEKIAQVIKGLELQHFHDREALEQKWDQCWDIFEQKTAQSMEAIEQKRLQLLKMAFEQKTVQEIEAWDHKMNQCMESLRQKVGPPLEAFREEVSQFMEKLKQRMVQEEKILEQILNKAKDPLEQKILAQERELTKFLHPRISVSKIRKH